MKQSVKMIVGNWKMHGVSADVSEALALKEGLAGAPPSCRIALCPPATLTDRLRRVLTDSAVEVGGQDCHEKASGAFTGSVSADMLADAGATLVILGHSERRAAFGETDADVAAKVEAAMAAGLEPIVCVGETLEQHEAGQAVAVVSTQITGSLPDGLSERDFAVAYEPVWAIGTGRNATPAQAGEAHDHIRQRLKQWFGLESSERCRVLYGGSVKPDNIASLMAQPDVDGALVGGASLDPKSFLAIIRGAVV